MYSNLYSLWNRTMFDWFSLDSETQIEDNFRSIEEKEEEFNNVVRENIIALLTFIILYIVAYCIIEYLHRKKERDGWYGGEDDAKVYRISLYLCAITLAVAISAVLMLPMSMVGNEIVHLFPESYWVQWLNGALIHNMWNSTYILSNLSIFVLLPFSYFFTESEGFSGQRRGLLPRVYETITVLLLLAVLVFGLAVLALAFFDQDNSGLDLLTMVGEYYMQYLYSFLLCCVAFIVVTSCAPVGFILLFDAVGKLLVKPKIFEKTDDDEITATRLEEETLKRKLHSYGLSLRGSRQNRENVKQRVDEVQKKRKELERKQNASAWERNLGYPLVMIILILLTGLALFLVSIHILEMLFIGDNELQPKTEKSAYHKDYRSFVYSEDNSHQEVEHKTWWSLITSPTWSADKKKRVSGLGASSLSAFGIVGTLLEVAVVFYLMLASVLGFYSLPGFRNMRPRCRDTSMTRIIFNCLVMQLLGSSLPVLCRILGITEFDLQGSYGQFSWLGNFYVVFLCNLVFAAVTALCLAQKVTIKIRTELYKALGLDKSEGWTSKWTKCNPGDEAAGTSGSPPPSPRPSTRNVMNLEEISDGDQKPKSAVNNITGPNKTSNEIIILGEEIDKLATKLLSDTSAKFLSHEQHIHDMNRTKESDIIGR